MDLRNSILRDLKVLYLNKKEELNLCNFNEIKKSQIFDNLKKNLKKIPFLWKFIWYFYNLLNGPFRVRELYKSVELLLKESHSVREELAYLRDSMRNEIAFLKEEMAFRYKELEEFKVLDMEKFVKGKMSNAGTEFYVFFENIFRNGNLKERLKKYLPFIKEVFDKSGRSGVFLDFGCGRGEFMKILKENGIAVIGVEINEEYVKRLKEEGFEVYLKDGIEFLKDLPNNSLVGVSGIHVIEHLEFEKQREFINLSYQKIKPEGLILIETPNPKCFVALANFYIDFTHIKPCPYEFLCFMLESAGFKDLKLILSSPVHREFRTGNPLGDYMDYAVIGFKRE